MIDFNYILRGFEVDEYCDILISKYGESSGIIQCLDKNYYDLRKTSHIYVEQLNAIRKFLYDNQACRSSHSVPRSSCSPDCRHSGT